ncbi:MAG TPA: hypothetical protein VE547_04165, partial [Mycobacteriales bacterium]|nr:hypothetical protein [Mycobacteriales bacterium]
MTKKVLLIVFGAVAALLGLGLGIGGGALLAVAGGDRYLESGEESLATPTYALVSEASILDNGSGSDADGFSVTLRVTARSDDGAAVFVGVAPSAEVERYLAGVPYDELRNLEFSPFRYETDRHQGEQAPGPPTDGPRWTGQAVGTGDQTLEFDTRAGTDHQVVVMNADGSEGVAVTASFGLRVPFLSAVGTGLLIAGVVFLLLGLALLVWGLRTKVQPRAP